MRRFRLLLTLLLGVLLLFDGVTAFRVWWYGLKHVSITNGRVTNEAVTFNGTDSLILILLAGLHGALIYGVWRAWRTPAIRV